MLIIPSIDRDRMRENLAELMAGASHTIGDLAGAVKLDPQVIADALAGSVHLDALKRVADHYKVDLAALAPLINLRDPDRGDRLPPEGRDVPVTSWWLSRLREGSVIRGDIPAPAEPAPASSPQRRGGAASGGDSQGA